MNGIVIIPCWQRPEFLAITLKYLSRADNWAQQALLFQIDVDPHPDIFKVIHPFINSGQNFIASPKTKGVGNSLNILEGFDNALKLSYKLGAPLIHLVEEDVWVGKDYFTFHESIHEDFNPFCVSACRNQHLFSDPPRSEDSVYLYPKYQSLGISFKRDIVAKILVHHCEQYHSNMLEYCKLKFPTSKFGSLFEEQDGLISRIIEQENNSVMYPFVPRAYHAGFYGYHRNSPQPEGDLAAKIIALEEMSDIDMNKIASYKDIKSCNLGGYDVANFSLKELQ